jgi:hypothetical protein
MVIWIYPAALLIGLALGLFGAGGGMLTVPALMTVGHLSVKQAVPMSLWIVALASLSAAIHQQVWKKLQYRLLIVLGVAGIIGSGAGARLGMLLPGNIQLGMLSVLIFFVAAWVGFIRLENKVQVFRYIPATLAGLGVGALTGMLGVGGGFLLVPVLIFLGLKHFPTAVGHSLVLITLNAISGAVSYLMMEKADIDLPSTLGIALVATIGSVLGGIVLQKVSSSSLQKGFAIVLIFLGSFVGWQSLNA